ncbi:hypothetical protein [Rubrivirga sp.]|uniref:hypothetical protein n=1 Tax=Rubrivirga sp. TaxID=1885344 RepID=UPI003C76E402
MDDPRLHSVTREAAARGRSPGWRASPPNRPSRLFADAEHGSPGAALDAALAWRDQPRPLPLPDAPVTLAPGIYLTTQSKGDRRYPVVKAIADDEGGNRKTLVRSLAKHGHEAALRQAAEHRFRYRFGLSGFDAPTADSLYRDALRCYQDHVEGADV